jgi:dTDP-4-amino-4,6-dideoxygalactose transaminase
LKIPISRTIFSQKDFEAIHFPLRSGWVVQGKYVKDFEDKWSAFTGSKHSIAVSNCTTALTLSLTVLGIGQGDEVILPSFTWIATANAVETLGAKPVLCDIDLNTFNIDASQIEKHITTKTKAIIPVHLFGLPAAMDEIIYLAEKHNLYIVEDAACGFGAQYKGKHVGTFGDLGCFSFHPRKAITTGEGGMITTQDDTLASKLRSLRNHGAAELSGNPAANHLADYPYAGYNFRLTDIQASIGSSQMDSAEETARIRNEIALKYDNFLKYIPWLCPQKSPQGCTNGYQSYVCLFKKNGSNILSNNLEQNSLARNNFMSYLNENGIQTRPGTHAVHFQTYYKNKYSFSPEDFLNSFIAEQCSVALPIYPSLSDEEFNYVTEKITDYSKKAI